MKQLLIELRKALAFDGRDYRTESYTSICRAIDAELAKPEPQGMRVRAWTDNDDIRASTSLEPTNATLFIDGGDGL